MDEPTTVIRPLKAVAYVRVSTDRQSEEGFGTIQHEAVRRWAKLAGHRLVAVHADEGLSGALPATARPGLAAALDMIRTGAADALVLPKLDRLARTLSVQEAALASIWAQGGRVFLPDGEVLRDDPDDPMRTAMRQMMGVFSQLERGMITARLRAGRAAKASAGGYAYGSPPYGWRADKTARPGWPRSPPSRRSSGGWWHGGPRAFPCVRWPGGSTPRASRRSAGPPTGTARGATRRQSGA